MEKVNNKKKYSISVIMPVHNGATTLKETLKSLLAQSLQFDELVIVDDASSDNSANLITNFLNGKIEYKLIQNNYQKGLAKTYNRGLKDSSGDLLVTLHQDILLDKDALRKLVEPFSDKEVVASTHIVEHPLEIWKRYNFWQKCFFARLVEKNFSGIDGKFDCFRRTALEKIGFFDEKHFRTAGEDGDMVYKLKKIGKVANTRAKIIHLHKIDPNFSWKDIIYKQKQYSEAQGVLLRLGRMQKISHIPIIFFREILVILFFIPYMNIVSATMIIIYSLMYTKKVYLTEYKNPRILVLPFLNFFLLFISFYYSLKGFVYGKQEI